MTKDELLNQIKVDHRQLERYLFYFVEARTVMLEKEPDHTHPK